ncbi:hypothetical protein HII31_06628 [Pseudocercospora fuligena]|uniref:F-box domain-containing protein n=1 Tax=Pseudocercospora fuligena TaxID=685502 RepID=A0A8H6VGZ0_9PEZI|nr:hypothetical protein HII31_06628 [Pseudocercospora fuligena]
MSSPHETTANSPTKAEKVFGTAELMENIMLNLGTRDVLTAMQATRAMRDTVLGSTKIQTLIGLLPDYECHFSVMPWETIGERQGFVVFPPNPNYNNAARPVIFHDFTLSNYSDTFNYGYDKFHPESYKDQWHQAQISNGGRADFVITAPRDDKCLRKLGSRVRALSICQPPVEYAYFDVNCGHWKCRYQLHQRFKEPDLEENALRNAEYLVSASGGVANRRYVTIGDLYKANIEVRKRHREICPWGKSKMYVTVSFCASVRLREDDPISIFRQRGETYIVEAERFQATDQGIVKED